MALGGSCHVFYPITWFMRVSRTRNWGEHEETYGRRIDARRKYWFCFQSISGFKIGARRGKGSWIDGRLSCIECSAAVCCLEASENNGFSKKYGWRPRNFWPESMLLKRVSFMPIICQALAGETVCRAVPGQIVASRVSDIDPNECGHG